MVRKALLLGDYDLARWHSMRGVDERVTAILRGSFDLECVEGCGGLDEGFLADFDLCISYLEFSAVKISDRQSEALRRYVRGGGGLLAIHNGISLQSDPGIATMIGAKFTGHPPYSALPRLNYRVIAREHPIMSGIGAFALPEEAYKFEFFAEQHVEILLEYEYEGEWLPAAWAQSFDQGRIAYLAPGHSAAVFSDASFSAMVKNSAAWCGRIRV